MMAMAKLVIPLITQAALTSSCMMGRMAMLTQVQRLSYLAMSQITMLTAYSFVDF
jgi:hypothetical protein